MDYGFVILYHFDQFGRHAPRTWVVWPKLKPCPVSQATLGPFSGSVRAPGARAASGAHHIRQVAKRKISSTWSQVTLLAKLNEMIQYGINVVYSLIIEYHLHDNESSGPTVVHV